MASYTYGKIPENYGKYPFNTHFTRMCNENMFQIMVEWENIAHGLLFICAICKKKLYLPKGWTSS